MEKFVLWFGSQTEEDFAPAVQVLKRSEKEIGEFFNFGFASLLTFKLAENVINKIESDSIIVIQLGDLTPNEEWIKYLEKDISEFALQDFKGSGLVFIINLEKKIINIILESWGRRVVYYSKVMQDNSPLLLSNEMKAILALDRSIGFIDNIDEKALVTLIGAHQCFGFRTIFKNIKLLPPGTISKISVKDNYPVIMQKMHYHQDYSNKMNFDDLVQNYSSLFRKIMLEQVQEKNFSGILLSGGKDSGLLMCALPKEFRHTFRCIHFGNNKISETNRARALINLLGGTFCFYELKPIDIGKENTYRHLWLTEGQSPSKVAFLESIAFHETGGIITGNPGDFNLGGTWSDKLTTYAKGKGDLRLMARRMVMRDEYWYTIFGKSKGKKYLTMFQDEILETIALESNENKQVALEMFVLKNRVQRHANLGMLPILEHLPVEEPYNYDEILSSTLVIPIQLRSDRKLQAAIIENLSSNASSFHWLQPAINDQSLKKSLMAFIKKIPWIRSLGRRILYRKVASSLENTYVPINTWMREDERYRKFIKDTLFETRTKERKLFDQKGVRKLFDEHVSGKANHMGKLLQLVDLEIFFRLFIDGDGFENPPKFVQTMKPPVITKISGNNN